MMYRGKRKLSLTVRRIRSHAPLRLWQGPSVSSAPLGADVDALSRWSVNRATDVRRLSPTSARGEEKLVLVQMVALGDFVRPRVAVALITDFKPLISNQPNCQSTWHHMNVSQVVQIPRTNLRSNMYVQNRRRITISARIDLCTAYSIYHFSML